MNVVIPLKSCPKCGSTIIVGTKYCKNCAVEEDDFEGFTSLDDFPLWVINLGFVIIIGVSLWMLYTVITGG